MEQEQIKELLTALKSIAKSLEIVARAQTQCDDELKEDQSEYYNIRRDMLLRDFKNFIKVSEKEYFEEKDFVALGLKNYNRLISMSTLSNWFKEFVLLSQFKESRVKGSYTLNE